MSVETRLVDIARFLIFCHACLKNANSHFNSARCLYKKNNKVQGSFHVLTGLEEICKISVIFKNKEIVEKKRFTFGESEKMRDHKSKFIPLASMLRFTFLDAHAFISKNSYLKSRAKFKELEPFFKKEREKSERYLKTPHGHMERKILRAILKGLIQSYQPRFKSVLDHILKDPRLKELDSNEDDMYYECLRYALYEAFTFDYSSNHIKNNLKVLFDEKKLGELRKDLLYVEYKENSEKFKTPEASLKNHKFLIDFFEIIHETLMNLTEKFTKTSVNIENMINTKGKLSESELEKFLATVFEKLKNFEQSKKHSS